MAHFKSNYLKTLVTLSWWTQCNRTLFLPRDPFLEKKLPPENPICNQSTKMHGADSDGWNSVSLFLNKKTVFLFNSYYCTAVSFFFNSGLYILPHAPQGCFLSLKSAIFKIFIIYLGLESSIQIKILRPITGSLHAALYLRWVILFPF